MTPVPSPAPTDALLAELRVTAHIVAELEELAAHDPAPRESRRAAAARSPAAAPTRVATWLLHARGLLTRLASVPPIGALLLLAALACSDTAAPPVAPAPVASVAVSPTERTLVVGDTLTLAVTVRGASGQPLTDRLTHWSSDAERVATVTAGGHVTALAPGTARVAVTSGGRRAIATISSGRDRPNPSPAWT